MWMRTRHNALPDLPTNAELDQHIQLLPGYDPVETAAGRYHFDYDAARRAIAFHHCYLCHFKPEPDGSKLKIAACTTCHEPPDKKIEYQDTKMSHKEMLARGVECTTCHAGVVEGIQKSGEQHERSGLKSMNPRYQLCSH